MTEFLEHAELVLEPQDMASLGGTVQRFQRDRHSALPIERFVDGAHPAGAEAADIGEALQRRKLTVASHHPIAPARDRPTLLRTGRHYISVKTRVADPTS